MPPAAIGFAATTRILETSRAARLRPHVRFERSVYTDAVAFARERLGAPAAYVAVHWSPAASGSDPALPQSAHSVARHARRLMRRHAVEKAFLTAEGATRGELAHVHAKLRPVRYQVAGAPAYTLREMVRRDHIELALCAMAHYFLGTRSSNFTAAVHEERAAIFGLDPSTAAEMDDDHSITVAPSDGRQPWLNHLKDEL